MDTQVSLRIDGFVYQVIKYHINLRRDIDRKGKPTSHSYGGLIHCTIVSGRDSNHFEWITSSLSTRRGEIIKHNHLNNGIDKLIRFDGAYLVEWAEEFNTHGQEAAFQENLVISAQKITFDEVVFENDWNMM